METREVHGAWGEQLESTAINIFAVPHLDDIDHKLIVLYRIHDSIDSGANAVSVATGKLLGTGRSWVFG